MHRRYESERLLNDMYTVYVESNLASPLAGNATVHINPRDTVRKLVNDFLFSLEKDDGVPGLAIFDTQYNKLDWDATVESQGIREGAKLYLAYDKASFFKPIHIAAVGIITIIIAAVLFITVSVLFGATGGDIPFDYGIVIDAGSTHTEVYLYQWSGSKYYGTGEVNQRNSCVIEKGIADGFDPSYLVSCVNNVTKFIPTDNTSPVYLYLGATAGMRLLNASNPLEANLVLTAIKYALQGTSALEGSIDIIEGQDEGLFSWITANFLSKTLIQTKVDFTYGALDLGGASTQFAYAETNTESTDVDVDVLKLYGQEYRILSKSFLCFGMTQAADRSDAIAFMDQRNKSIIDPCLPKNYSLKLETREFLERPCIQNENLTNWLDLNGNVKELNVIGGGDYKGCKILVEKLVNTETCKNMEFKQCLEPINLAETNRKFMAFSSFYYIVNYLSPDGSYNTFVNATEEFCNLSYDQIKEKTKDKKLLKHLVRYCFGALYINELLTVNYGFTEASWRTSLEFRQSIAGADVGWALGFMINATNAIPEELPTPPVISAAVFAPLIAISILMVIFAFVLLQKNFNICRRKRTDTLVSSVGDI